MEFIGEQQTEETTPPSATTTFDPFENTLRPTIAPNILTIPPEQLAANRAWRRQVIASANVLWQILAVRILALVGIIGAGLLTWVSEMNPDAYKLGLLGIYCGGVSLVVWLASRK